MADPRLAGLPTFLLPVPAGTVEMGMTAEALVNAASQVVSPARPAMAAKSAPTKLAEAIRKSASVLGRRKVDVAEFLLAKWPVKCSEYESFLVLRRQQGQHLRPPFGWWRYGRADDYTAKLPEITREFPKDKMGPVLFWERHGADLPYLLQDEKGRSIADHPVTHVDYRDANQFAAWFGMRLPTEAEMTRAMRGDGTQVWPWGKGDPALDVFSDQALQQLQIFNSRDQVLKPVGTVPAAVGPYGHLDLFGQVWQLVSGLGYRPINGADPFATEWKDLQKDKAGALVQAPPTWKDDRAVAKGGSFLSGGDPIQLLVDARAPVQTIDVLEGLGFRLAKSLKPGYDMLFSLLRGTYNRGPFAIDQDIDLAAQVGAERYELAANGFPTAYHAVSFAPVNWLSNDKTAELAKLLEKTHTAPLLVGTLATTIALQDPAVPAGHYSVLFRKEGMPRELVEAIKAGHKEVLAGQKGKGSKDEGDPTDGDGDKNDKKEGKERKAGWREIIARYGLTEKDLEAKEAANGLKFVRVDGLEVSTERDCFLLHGNDGKVVAAIPATNHKPTAATPFPPELTLEADAKGRAVAKFRAGAPLHSQNPKKVVDIHLHVTLDRAVPGADAPWRMPGR